MGAYTSRISFRTKRSGRSLILGLTTTRNLDDEAVMAVATRVAPADGHEWDGEFRRPIACPDHYHHFMPPNMPLCPVYDVAHVALCNHTWKTICKAGTPKMKEYHKEGIVLFYDEFFHRLFQRDPGFNEVFPGIRKRIEVLIKAMKFLLNDSGVPELQVRDRCRNLGYRHKSIPLVRPHHFATYASTFVEVAMFWLDTEATPNVGEAWSNVIGYNLKRVESKCCSVGTTARQAAATKKDRRQR
ncbi:hypothetical protein LEN26_009306 [Aphanomyces euteiches]|nr:hypothetical protein AeMF1_009378 [Aphanomyces euteiches]KAH9127054.1 hypothetical protein LEN26_009306 [Aphanomyces euteiches]KAH9190754.1 hypothetical protein AeNC1_007275 [Aphanomyces euteiches]